MNKKGWKLAGILGGAFLMIAGAGMEVHAEETSIEVTNYILEVQDWDNRAVADVKKYANIRETKSTKADIVGVLPKGAIAEVVAVEGEWTKIGSGEIEGYIKTELLLFDEEAKELYNEVHGVRGIVTAKSVKIRKEPSANSESVGAKTKGSVVQILAQRGDWYRIQINKDTTGYMHADYVEIDEVAAMTLKEYKAKNSKSSSTSASTSDIAMLAAIIECEAGGESYTGKVAVGAVVLNRVRSSEFPNTIEGVIKQKGQFTPVASGKFARVLSRGANSTCYQAAMDALNGSNPIGNCLFFNTGRGKGFRLGNHQFY